MHKSALPMPHQRLIEQCQRINFGRLEGLTVRAGQPVFDPPPRVIREVKFCGDNGPRPEAAQGDFLLKTQVRGLLAQLEAMGSGTVCCLEVKHGLPFKMTVEEVLA